MRRWGDVNVTHPPVITTATGPTMPHWSGPAPNFQAPVPL